MIIITFFVILKSIYFVKMLNYTNNLLINYIKQPFLVILTYLRSLATKVRTALYFEKIVTLK